MKSMISLGLSMPVSFADPNWGCGLLGPIPGITNGVAAPETQRMINGLKNTSSYGKVSVWNWNLAPQTLPGSGKEALTHDFLFMPEQWGNEVVKDQYVRPAMQANFIDSDGDVCPAMMADILLGANEPDMGGSCMGGMMGRCTEPCTAADVNGGDCPTCHLDAPQGSESPNAHGRCDCWSASHATGSGFWPLDGCAGNQPMPHLFDDPHCVDTIKTFNAQTGAIAAAKGYKYLSTPLVAVNMDYLEKFVEMACNGCSSITCGCPTHVGWHFYANDCRPVELGGYADFQKKLNATVRIMERFPAIRGAIINEVGMLNCVQETADGPCIPGGPSQRYPADKQPGHTCPSTDELPRGMASFVEHLVGMAARAKTSDGRGAVAGFSWFNENQDGGTYDLRLFNDDGSINAVGEAYIKGCQAWASGVPPSLSTVPPPTHPGAPKRKALDFTEHIVGVLVV